MISEIDLKVKQYLKKIYSIIMSLLYDNIIIINKLYILDK